MIDYFLSHLWQVWTALCIICLILELSSGDFYIMCFSLGALVAAIASPLVGGIAQIVIFAIASILCLTLVRPTVLRHLHKSRDERVSNVDAIIGRTGRVSQTIEADGHGRVAIDGDDWKAVSADGSEIQKDELVEVVSIDSIIITVARK